MHQSLQNLAFDWRFKHPGRTAPMRFERTPKVLAKCELKYYRTSERSCHLLHDVALDNQIQAISECLLSLQLLASVSSLHSALSAWGLETPMSFALHRNQKWVETLSSSGAGWSNRSQPRSEQTSRCLNRFVQVSQSCRCPGSSQQPTWRLHVHRSLP